jgi:hypothetical protein
MRLMKIIYLNGKDKTWNTRNTVEIARQSWETKQTNRQTNRQKVKDGMGVFNFWEKFCGRNKQKLKMKKCFEAKSSKRTKP